MGTYRLSILCSIKEVVVEIPWLNQVRLLLQYQNFLLITFLAIREERIKEYSIFPIKDITKIVQKYEYVPHNK